MSLGPFYELIGGEETCRLLSARFHERVAEDAVLKAIFPSNMDSLSESFTLFLGERLGGPAAYTAKRGKQSLICRHAHLSISTDESQRWLGHMFAAIDEADIPDPANRRLKEFLTETAQSLTDPFLPYYKLPLDELADRIRQEQGLLRACPAGHSLLRNAASEWDAPRTKLLLDAGADPNLEEILGHGPLYRAVNSTGREADGREVVALLLKSGASVDHPSGPGKSTPLHVAARRGHVSLAELLLEAGANLEAKDSNGETPLRRAVNCRQEAVVKFLIAKGANPQSRDKFGKTPEDAARSETLRAALGCTIA